LAPETVDVWVGKARVALPAAPAEPPVVAGGDTSARTKNVLRLPDVRLHVDEIDVELPGVMLHARDVVVRGDLGDAQGGSLVTGACHAAWQGGRRVSGWDRCELTGRLAGRALTIDRLRLSRGGALVVVVQGQATLPAKDAPASGTLYAELDLAPWEAAALAGEALPLGLVAQGVEVRLAGDAVSGSIAALHAPLVTNGPFHAEHVAFEVPRFDGEPGLLVPKVALTASGLVAARAEALDWAIDGIAVPHLAFELQKKLIGQMPGVHFDRWTHPGGVTGPVAADVDLAIGISGGTVSGLVTTPDAVLLASGRLKRSPITNRSSFVATADFDDLRGPLAALVLHDLVDAERDLLAGGAGAPMPPLDGRLELAVELERESRSDPWELTLEWDATELVAATRLVWDGSAWSEEPAVADHDGDDDDAPDDDDDAPDDDGGDTP
jgi:hypothetical protein